MQTITIPRGRRVSVTQYVAAWRAVKAAPDHDFTGWDDFQVTGAEVRAEMIRGLHDRINQRGGLIIRNPGQWDAWRRDQRAIADYRLHRIVRRGSGLETAEGRRAAPDVHDAFRSCEA